MPSNYDGNMDYVTNIITLMNWNSNWYTAVLTNDCLADTITCNVTMVASTTGGFLIDIPNPVFQLL